MVCPDPRTVRWPVLYLLSHNLNHLRRKPMTYVTRIGMAVSAVALCLVANAGLADNHDESKKVGGKDKLMMGGKEGGKDKMMMGGKEGGKDKLMMGGKEGGKDKLMMGGKEGGKEGG